MAVTANPASARILLDLGIEPVDVYAMENAEKTYMSALREGIVTIEAATKGKGDSRSAILRDEFRRVRDKKRKKVNVSKLFERKHVLPVNKIKPQALLPPSEEISPSGSKKDEMGSILREILHILKLQFELDKKESAEDTKRRERQKQEERENAIESLTGGVKSALNVGKKLVGKLISPLKTVWESIANFLKFTIIGALFNGALNWFGEKENQEKMGRVWRFLKFWWPSILAGYLAFFTPIGGLVTGVVRFLTWALPALAGVIAANPLLASVMGLAGALGVAGWWLSKEVQEPRIEAEAETTVNRIQAGVDPYDAQFRTGDVGGPGSLERINQQMLNPTAIPGDFDYRGGIDKFNKGGAVRGRGNRDTVPAMLTPGEFVMTKGAVEKYGVNTLAGMNAAAGGTNTPQYKEGRVYARSGGEVLSPSSSLTENYIEVAGKRYDSTNITERQQKVIQMVMSMGNFNILKNNGERFSSTDGEGIKQWIPADVKGTLPVRVPVKVNTESRSIVLPTLKKERAEDLGSVREGSTIPTFDISSKSSSRYVTLLAIGVDS